MYDTSINVHVYPSLPVDVEAIVLLLASMLLAVILTAELDLLVWYVTDCTGKVPGGLYIIKIVTTCFACRHFLFYVYFLSNLLLKLSPKVYQQQYFVTLAQLVP